MTLIVVYLISVLVSWKFCGYCIKKLDNYSNVIQTVIYGVITLSMLATLSYVVIDGINTMKNRHYLNYIPYEMNVTEVSYMETEA